MGCLEFLMSEVDFCAATETKKKKKVQEKKTMTKLNQIIAIEKGEKTRAQKSLTEAYRTVDKEGMYRGIARTYQPRDDEGERFPDEKQNVQLTYQRALLKMRDALTRMYDVTATKDWANTSARADVVVNGQVIVPNAPVTYLLFLEKRLEDVRTYIKKIPTLESSETWTPNREQGHHESERIKTTKTKKVLRNHVKAEATEHHPAQVETYTEDIVVGYWNTVKFSGAIPPTTREQLLDRVNDLLNAVQFAREEANAREIDDVTVSKQIFDFILGDINA